MGQLVTIKMSTLFFIHSWMDKKNMTWSHECAPCHTDIPTSSSQFSSLVSNTRSSLDFNLNKSELEELNLKWMARSKLSLPDTSDHYFVDKSGHEHMPRKIKHEVHHGRDLGSNNEAGMKQNMGVSSTAKTKQKMRVNLNPLLSYLGQQV
jgi:hypothetical protein